MVPNVNQFAHVWFEIIKLKSMFENSNDVSMNIDKTQDCVGMKWVVLGSNKRISEAQKFLDDYIVLHTATPEL